jgi:S1-C subfamily serine protease
MKNVHLKPVLSVTAGCLLLATVNTAILLFSQHAYGSVSPVHAAPQGGVHLVAAPASSTRPGAAPQFRLASSHSDALTPDERVNVNVYKTANRSVVFISTVAPTTDMFYRVIPVEGEGSGCVLTSDGYILTNNHVVKNATNVKVTLWDGTTFPAEITGVDPDYDCAVIKINPGKKVLTPIALGDSTDLEVGRRVFAIGAPFGFDHTMTTGIVSNTSRQLNSADGRRVVKGIIQTDAPINPGNSGGPLLNTRGEMIGLTTAIYSKIGGGNAQWGGIGFAIPINTVKQIFPQLIAHHRVIRPELGIDKVKPIPGGLMVVTLIPGGPAEHAGVCGVKVTVHQQGPFTVQNIDTDAADLITGIDDRKVVTVDDLLSYIENKKAGQVVTLSILRQGKNIKVPVKLTTSSPQKDTGNDE